MKATFKNWTPARGKRFKVFFVAYGGFCSPLFVDREGYVTLEDGEAINPYHVDNAHMCPHCTSKRNWRRAIKIQQRGKKRRVSKMRVVAVANPGTGKQRRAA